MAPAPQQRPRPKTRRSALARLRAWALGLPPWAGASAAVALLAAVTVGDALAGLRISFTPLYLLPIALATWLVSRRTGLLLSAAAAAAEIGVADAVEPLPWAIAAFNFAVQLGVFLGAVALISTLQRRLEVEQQLARTDPLTGVANRRAFVEQALLEIARARRTGRPLTLAYVDVDDFKLVNDRYGHAEGDAILVETAAVLRGETRSIDGVARLGGDEFGLLLVDTDHLATEVLTSRLRASLDGRMARRACAVGFSIGACTFLSPPRSIDELLSHADTLMYEAKRAGKNQLRLAVVGGEIAPLSSVSVG